MRIASAIALLALGFSAPAFAETNVGVTAAVNQDAKGIVGSNVKTISLGDGVVFNQRIQTGGSGLVQVLLADGTTFMVGPNSDLVIDSFVYDPNAGTAQVTASFTKGVLRFIGGQTSKTPGGVTINTPVGTMGIRGAMVDVVLDPPNGTPPHVDMLFGNEVTLEQGKELLGRLYAAGYSLALGPNGTFDVLKTPPGWGSQIQAALAGKPGTSGGAGKGPSDGDVKNSGVANNNSGKGPNKDGLSEKELKALLEAAAHYDELRNFILNNNVPQGYVGGILSADADDTSVSTLMVNLFDSETGESSYSRFAFDQQGNPIGIIAPMLLTNCSGNCPVLTYEGTTNSGTLTASVPQFPDAPTTDFPTSGNVLVDHTAVLTEDELEDLQCADCAAFIRWGFWGFYSGNVSAGEVQGSLSLEGTWVTGDLTTRAQLNTLAGNGTTTATTAHYTGDAVGTVYNEGSVYTARGDLSLDWNFGSRDGVIEIGGFDTENRGDGAGIAFGGNIAAEPNGMAFTGSLEGEGPLGFGFAQGSFVNAGSSLAQGVIGNFGFAESEDYFASGVFMGTQPQD
jgi:hypothetical protein